MRDDRCTFDRLLVAEKMFPWGCTLHADSVLNFTFGSKHHATFVVVECVVKKGLGCIARGAVVQAPKTVRPSWRGNSKSSATKRNTTTEHSFRFDTFAIRFSYPRH